MRGRSSAANENAGSTYYYGPFSGSAASISKIFRSRGTRTGTPEVYGSQDDTSVPSSVEKGSKTVYKTVSYGYDYNSDRA